MNSHADRQLTTYSLPFSDFPYFLYDFETNGKHTGEQEINDEVELRVVFDDIIPTTLKAERKLIIKDQWGQCIFHIEDGLLIFPDRETFKMMIDNDMERLEW